MGRKLWRRLRGDWDCSDDFRGVDISAPPIILQTLTGWAGLSAVWYGVNLAVDGNNAVAVPWLVIGSLLGISSIWTDINSRVERSRAWNRWLNDEHGQIREAQSINADTMHEEVTRYQNQVDDLRQRVEDLQEELRAEGDRAESEFRREIFSHMESMDREFNDRVNEIDRSVGDLMRRCEETCHSGKK